MDWIIVGGESGAHARPMHPTWAREIRDVATEYGVPFHFKQWGEYEPLGWSCTILDEPESGPGPCRITLGDGYLVAAPERAGWSWSDETYSVRTGKATAGRMLDGRTHDDRPRVCRVAP
jgi:protein gp37